MCRRVALWLPAAAAAALLTSPRAVSQCSPTQVFASDAGVGDHLGRSVAIFGDTALLGAPDGPAGTGRGFAYVYRWNGAGWGEEAKLIASDAAAGDAFGNRVAVFGDTAVVGAQHDDGPAGFGQGSAYVFVRSGTIWTQQAKLTADDGAGGDSFGGSVAISGDTAIVGASSDTGPAGAFQGSAYVFVRSGASWTQQAKLTASDAGAGDHFGFSVAIDGDTAIVTASSDTGPGGAQQGSAYVFVRSGTMWTQQAKLTASDAATSDIFGISAAISGDTVAVGASFDDGAAGFEQGSAYVFVRSGTMWTQQAKLQASDAAAEDQFGVSVAISGDTVIAGAESDDGPAGADHGSAYIFVRSGTTWTQQAKLTASDAAAGDWFGARVAISGDAAVAGALRDDGPTGSDQGSAWFFNVAQECLPVPCPADLNGDGQVGATDLAILGGNWGSASFLADLDGDGFVGAPDLALLLGSWGACP